MADLFLKKTIASIQADGAEGGAVPAGGRLKRALGPFHLTMVGIGAIVGAGIFTMTGAGAALYAGPAIAYSFVLAGFLSFLAGLCYAEMATMLPLSGSAYTYSYATMGEFVAWIIGWDLILEYTFGAVIVANAWSSYLVSLVAGSGHLGLADGLMRFTKGPWEAVVLGDGSLASGIWNLPATLIVLGVGLVVYRGVKESAFLTSVMVFIKVAVILGFVVLGWSVVDPSFWHADSARSGLQGLVPPQQWLLRNGQWTQGFGWPGVLTGTGVAFLAYIGFDIIAASAQECRNPSRDIPLGIIGSLVVCALMYVLVSLVLTGVVPFRDLGRSDPIALGIDQIVHRRGWPAGLQGLISILVKVGALAGLTSVLLTFVYGQSRIFFAMGRDGLLPWFDRVHPRFSTPHVATVVPVLAIAAGGGLLPLSLVGELVSIGTLLAFTIVCLGIPILRVTAPKVRRPFRTPVAWVTGPVGALACLGVMAALPGSAWARLGLWLALGLLVYFSYGLGHSKLRNPRPAVAPGPAPSQVPP